MLLNALCATGAEPSIVALCRAATKIAAGARAAAETAATAVCKLPFVSNSVRRTAIPIVNVN